MTTYKYDHMHLRSRDPMATAQYFEKMFGAIILESVQTDGQSRIDIDLNGLTIFLAKANENTPDGPAIPYVGLDHFGLQVDDIETAATELKSKGAEFVAEPYQLRPGLKIAFVNVPGNIRVELLERE
jgi:lactoylglutathione lyase